MSFSLKYKKILLENLHTDTINSIDVQNENILFSCSDDELNMYNLSSMDKKQLYNIRERNSKKDDEELNCLKLASYDENKNFLFVSNDNKILLFDTNSLTQISKLKFSKETINSIDIHKNNSLMAVGDDSGEIKLIDMRANKTAAKLDLTMKKSLNKHSNICFTVKFNPLNDTHLFSGSFDCSIIQWDIRNVKKSYLNKIDITETLMNLASSSEANQNKEIDSSPFFSSMTPCFVHNLHFASHAADNSSSSKDFSNLLMCGIENGFCMIFNASSCQYIAHDQLQSPNCALTQFSNFESSISISSDDMNNKTYRNVMTVAGNSSLIEFIYLNDLDQADVVAVSSRNDKAIANESNYRNLPRLKIGVIDELKIDHKMKINCLKYLSEKKCLVVADTSNAVSIYDFTDLNIN